MQVRPHLEGISAPPRWLGALLAVAVTLFLSVLPLRTPQLGAPPGLATLTGPAVPVCTAGLGHAVWRELASMSAHAPDREPRPLGLGGVVLPGGFGPAASELSARRVVTDRRRPLFADHPLRAPPALA